MGGGGGGVIGLGGMGDGRGSKSQDRGEWTGGVVTVAGEG